MIKIVEDHIMLLLFFKSTFSLIIFHYFWFYQNCHWRSQEFSFLYFVEKRFNVFFINFTMKLSGFIKILTYILMDNLCPCFKIIERVVYTYCCNISNSKCSFWSCHYFMILSEIKELLYQKPVDSDTK